MDYSEASVRKRTESSAGVRLWTIRVASSNGALRRYLKFDFSVAPGICETSVRHILRLLRGLDFERERFQGEFLECSIGLCCGEESFLTVGSHVRDGREILLEEMFAQAHRASDVLLSSEEILMLLEVIPVGKEEIVSSL